MFDTERTARETDSEARYSEPDASANEDVPHVATNGGVRRRTVGRAQKAASPESPRDALQLYLSQIRAIPLLGRERVNALSAEIDACEKRFREALANVPAASFGVLERWRERLESGRSTALLAHGYRGDVKVDWAARIDLHLGRLGRLVEELSGPRSLQQKGGRAFRARASDVRRMSEHLREADILLEELVAVHDELVALVGDGTQRTRRCAALGLGQATARAWLSRATQALDDRSEVRQRFATHNLKLVVKSAKRFRGLGLSFMDLIQEGNKGLLRAVEKYDHTKGFTFSTYAVWWIDQAIIRGIQNHSRTVRVPSHIHQEQRRVREIEQQLRRVLQREPSLSELATETGIDEEQLSCVLASGRPIQSLDEPIGEKGRSNVGDTLADPTESQPGDDIDLQRIRGILGRGLRSLEERERQILRWRFGLDEDAPRTLRAIGRALGISRERVRQIEVKALEKLRDREDVDELGPHFASQDERPAAA